MPLVPIQALPTSILSYADAKKLFVISNKTLMTRTRYVQVNSDVILANYTYKKTRYVWTLSSVILVNYIYILKN